LVAAEKSLNAALADQKKKQEAVTAATAKQEGISTLLESAKEDKLAVEQKIAALKKWQEA
jgi:hypothetical protein